MAWHVTVWYWSPCTPQSGRMLRSNSWWRGWGLKREKNHGLVLITRQQKHVNVDGWAVRSLLCVGFGLLCRYRIVYRFLVFRYGNDNYRYRYHYRRFFGFIVSKCYLFRYPTLLDSYFVLSSIATKSVYPFSTSFWWSPWLAPTAQPWTHIYMYIIHTWTPRTDRWSVWSVPTTALQFMT